LIHLSCGLTLALSILFFFFFFVASTVLIDFHRNTSSANLGLSEGKQHKHMRTKSTITTAPVQNTRPSTTKNKTIALSHYQRTPLVVDVVVVITVATSGGLVVVGVVAAAIEVEGGSGVSTISALTSVDT
jgi:hypothetical protein